MKPRRASTWKTLALLATILALLLLLLPHPAGHHAAALAFLLVPIFLLLEPVEASVPYQPRYNHAIALNHHLRSTLFQRPPPSQA